MLYLDHHAATPVSPRVRAAIAEAHELSWANASSVHAAGRAARARVEQARRVLADAVRCAPADLIFTGGGTEACNLAVLGLAARRVVTSALEHPAIVEATHVLARRGAERVELPVSPEHGMPTPASLDEALQAGDLVALQWVNHETGAIADVAEYGRLCRARGATLVVDASQVLGKLPCDVQTVGAAALVFASTKLGGPAGAAALYLERGRELTSQSFGGAQERGRRAGSSDVAALAGFAAALEALPERLAAMPRLARLRDRLEQCGRELGALPNALEPRVATVTNLSFPGWRSEVLVAALDLEGLCASAGAACSSGLGEPSPVLRALYPDAPSRAESALRLSLGPENDATDIEHACQVLRKVLARGRA